MRLKKIEVIGFKSFADRQVVLVDDHVTGVIGPNGCGKSNIVDAIRWCLGEQSAKHLRGSGMADVIFAGCSSRGPAGMAEVTLTFLNTGDVPATYLDIAEIGITRRLFADGTSEYLINKVPARLRDIGDLLAGTGVGTKGYSIIEQGQVGKIVSSKPEDRRQIIDEAAGITRFKAQKVAASRKIEATRQNLLRVRDVITELDDRLSTLRRQAQKAERYKKYREELRDLDLWAAAHRLLELHATRGVLGARRAALGQQIDDVRASLSARDAQVAKGRIVLGEIEQELGVRQQRVFDLDNRVRLREAEDDYRRRERESQLGTGAQARAEADAAARALAHVEGELAELEAERRELGDVEGEGGAPDAVARLEGMLGRVEAELWTERSRRDAAARELAERGSAQAAGTARAQAVAEAQADLGVREQTAAAALAVVREERDAVATTRGKQAAQRDELAASLAIHRDRRGAIDRERASLKQQVAQAEVELDTQRAEVHRCRSRLQSLEEIQARYRSCNSGVQVVMQHEDELDATAALEAGASASSEAGASSPARRASFHGIVADHIQAPEHLESAVSAVLGDRLEGVLVDAPGDAMRGIEVLKRAQEGRISFVPLHARGQGGSDVRPVEGVPIGWASPHAAPRAIEVVDFADAGASDVPESASEPSESFAPEPAVAREPVGAALPPGVLGRLADLVQASPELAGLVQVLLGDAVVVEHLGRALELWQTGRYDATLVTLDGDRVEPSGVVVGGSPTALNAALLQQKREIRELAEILAELQAAFEVTRGRHLALASTASELEAEREREEAAVLAAQTSLAACEAELAAADASAARLADDERSKDAELGAVRAELDLRAREAESLARMLADLARRIEELEGDTSSADGRVVALTEEREKVGAELTEAKVALARWQQKSDALAGTTERLVRQREAESVRLDRLRETATLAETRAAELAELLEQGKSEHTVLVGESREATAAVHDSRERHDAIRLELDELDASLRTLRGELDEHRERLQEVEIGVRENEMELGHLEVDTHERHAVVLSEVLVDFHDRPLCGADQIERAAELKRIISRMGEVNLTAIEEFQEVSVRHEYLVRQRDDLENAVAQLQEAIDRIDKTTRQMFKDTFHAVNERFQQLFPRLFAGGRASLELTNPDDMLETGVEIVAQPPGKQLRSLDLLSGGEKALTAVSLIFAIFLMKPSPFCLLDEVDAPLDDVNVGRFCSLVRELAANTQFIIITHNKVSMETADRLYGVTMEQRGVSKLVSVNIRRAVELAYS
jgi:chromosome segregation protein